MKLSIPCLIFSCLTALALPPVPTPSVSLSWNYSSNELAMADSNRWPYSFKIYCTNLVTAATPWPLMYSGSASNTPIIGFDGTNYTYAVTSSVAPGQMFFIATVSNIWGESGPSNTSSVPPVTSFLHTKIFPN